MRNSVCGFKGAGLWIGLWSISAVLVFVAGCSSEQAAGPMGAADPKCDLRMDKERVMVVSEDVLQQLRFDIEKFDEGAGYIRTRPLSGAQLFQFWRGDNAGLYNTAEANMHSLEKTVEMSFSDTGQRVCVDCDVFVRRLSLRGRPVYGMSSMPGLFTGGSQSRQYLEIPADRVSWIDLGHDGRLEREILRRIEEKIGSLQGGGS